MVLASTDDRRLTDENIMGKRSFVERLVGREKPALARTTHVPFVPVAARNTRGSSARQRVQHAIERFAGTHSVAGFDRVGIVVAADVGRMSLGGVQLGENR